MRILFVGNFVNTGGSAIATITLALYLRSQGYKVSLAHWTLPNKINLFSQIGLLNLKLHFYKTLIGKIIYLTKVSIEYDLIIAVSELSITYACQIAGRLSKRPVWAEIHVNLEEWIENNSNPIHYFLSSYFYPRLNRIRCASKGLTETAIRKFNISENRVFTIYNPFDIDKIQVLSKKKLPKQFELWYENPVILCAGRLEKQKRFDLAISAFKILIEKTDIPFRMIILGEGIEKHNLQQQINQLKIQNKVYLAGFYNNPYSFFAKSKMFLLCSDYEGFGRVLVEAMACGCPVIAHDCPFGPKEVLDNGKSGLLISDNNPKTITDAIIELSDNNTLYSTLRYEGYKRVKEFESEKICNQYTAKLKQYLNFVE